MSATLTAADRVRGGGPAGRLALPAPRPRTGPGRLRRPARPRARRGADGGRRRGGAHGRPARPRRPRRGRAHRRRARERPWRRGPAGAGRVALRRDDRSRRPRVVAGAAAPRASRTSRPTGCGRTRTPAARSCRSPAGRCATRSAAATPAPACAGARGRRSCWRRAGPSRSSCATPRSSDGGRERRRRVPGRRARAPRARELGVPRRPECVLLTPRFRRSRHIVVLVLGAGGRGRCSWPSSRGSPATARPWRARRAICGPRARARGHRARARRPPRGPGHPLLLQTALAGRPLGPAAVRRDRDSAVAVVAAWLERLAAATATFPPDDGWYERLVGAPLRTLAARGGPEREWARATLAAAEPLREAGLPLVAAHGDLGHPNLLLATDGRLGVLDWERAEPRGLPVGDLVFFLAYAAAAGRGDQRARVARLRAAFAGPREWAWQAIERHADAVGIKRRLVAPLVAVSCARVALEAGPPAALDAAARHLELWEPALRAAPVPADPGPRVNVLYLTSEFPYPLTSGHLRHFHFLRGLAGEHAITHLSLTRRAVVGPDALAALAPYVERQRVFGEGGGRGGPVRRQARVTRAARDLRAAVAAHLARGGTDVVLLSGKETHPALAAIGDAALVVDMCDAASVRLRGELAVADQRRRVAVAVRLAEIAPHRAHGWPRARRTCCSPPSATATAVGAARRRVVAQRRRPRLLDAPPPAGRGLGVVFTGVMAYRPNHDAAMRLVERDRPARARGACRTPGGHRRPRPAARAAGAAAGPGVTVTGARRGPAARTSRRAAVYCAPLRFAVGHPEQAARGAGDGDPRGHHAGRRRRAARRRRGAALVVAERRRRRSPRRSCACCGDPAERGAAGRRRPRVRRATISRGGAPVARLVEGALDRGACPAAGAAPPPAGHPRPPSSRPETERPRASPSPSSAATAPARRRSPARLERETDLPVRYLYMGVSADSSNRQLPTTRLAHRSSARRGARARHRRPRSRPSPARRRRAAQALRRSSALDAAADQPAGRGVVPPAASRMALPAARGLDRRLRPPLRRRLPRARHGRASAARSSRRVHGWLLLTRPTRSPTSSIFLDAPPEVLLRPQGRGDDRLAGPPARGVPAARRTRADALRRRVGDAAARRRSSTEVAAIVRESPGRAA